MAEAMLLRMVAPTRDLQGKPGDRQHGCRREPGHEAGAREPLPTACLPVLTVDVADPIARELRGQGGRHPGDGGGAHGVAMLSLSCVPGPAAARPSRGGP